jgi:hypothetical protein
MWSLHARGHFRVFTIVQHTNPAERSFTLHSRQRVDGTKRRLYVLLFLTLRHVLGQIHWCHLYLAVRSAPLEHTGGQRWRLKRSVKYRSVW